MSAIVIYWSGSGNTQSIAEKIAGDLGIEAKSVSEISVNDALSYDTLILGCPAMGAEELEDTEFRPFFEELMSSVGQKRIFLFGSYGWGDGEWMRNWQSEVESLCGNLVCDGLIVNGDSQEIDESLYQDFISKI